MKTQTLPRLLDRKALADELGVKLLERLGGDE